MTRTYGLSQPFIMSGDLRLSLAMFAEGTREHKLLTQQLAADRFIYVGKDSRTLFYRSEHLETQARFLENLYKMEAPFLNRFGQRMHMQGAWHKGTCVIVGSGPGVEVPAVQDAQDAGAVILALGNACFLHKNADIWVGHGPVPGYYPHGLESPRTMALVPKQYKNSNLWDMSRKEFTSTRVEDLPNVLYYSESYRKGGKDFFDNPAITGFGVQSSFTVALSAAVVLGFTNIVVTGVDLGGTLDRFFGFPEIPHQETYKAKLAKYSQVSGILNSVLESYAEHGIRVYGIGNTALAVPSFPPDLVKSLFLGLLPRSRQVRDLRGITVPDHTKIKLRSILEKHREASLTVQHLFETAQILVERAPSMNTLDVQKSMAQLDKALKAGGCSSCSKKTFLNPVYEKFVQEALAGNASVVALWEELYPTQYVIMRHGKMNFRPDKKHLEDELNELTL